MTDRSNAAAAAWLRLVEKGLGGRPFSDLVATTPEGIEIQPVEPPAVPLRLRGRGALPWARLQRIDHPDPGGSARLALEALNGGAAGLVLVLRGSPQARGFGLAPDDLAGILADVQIDACPLRLETGFDGASIALSFAAEVKARRIDPALVDIAFGIDPISAMAASGSGFSDWEELRQAATGTVARLAGAGFRGPFLTADGRRAHEAGADAASELAFVLASAVASLRLAAEAGLGADRIAGAIDLVLAADGDRFLTIAKFRAARLLLARVLEATGLPARALRLHGETSFRMTTRLDPHSNLVRASIAAFSAGVGGVDSLAVLPYTAPFGLAGDAARRLALDTQSILVEEAGIWRVDDPASGAGSLEALTLDLCTEAWLRFQAIEREGGLPGALASGALQQRISAERQARQAGIATGAQPMIGTNLFRAPPSADIDLDATLPWPEAVRPAEFEPLPSQRASAAAEEMAA